MITKQVQMDPQLAAELLKGNTHNRRLNQATFMRYVEDMVNNRWLFNGVPVIIDTHGRVVDGQHRLHAVIESGVTVPMIIVEGIGMEAQNTIDIGRPRSVADQLAIEGVGSATIAASVATMLARYNKWPQYVWGGHRTPSKTDQMDFYYKYQEFMPEATAAARSAFSNIRVQKSVYGSLYVLVALAHRLDYWQEFHDGVISGANLDEGDPRLAFRNVPLQATKSKQGTWLAQMNLAKGIRAFNAFRLGYEVKLLKFSPKNLPMPEIE